MHQSTKTSRPAALDRKIGALFASQIILAIADALAPRSVVLLSFYWVPVVLSVAFATPRQVSILAGVAMALGVAAGFHAGHGHYSSLDYPVNLVALFIISAISVFVAHSRQKAETIRRETSQHLAREQKLLGIVLDHVEAHIYVKDREGRFIYANPPSLQMLGRSLPEVIGRTNAELFPADVASTLTASDEAVFSADAPVQVEETVTMPGGEDRIFLSEKVLLRLPGEPPRLIGFSADITAIKKAEAQRRELEDLRRRELLEMTDSIPVGTFVVKLGTDGVPKFDFISKRLLQILQLTPEQVQNDAMAAYSLVHPDDYDEMIRLNSEAFATGKDFQWEGRMNIGGKTRWVRIESVARALPGERRAWNGVLTDITDRKETEMKLARREEQLEDVNSKLVAAREGLVMDKMRLNAILDGLIDPHVMFKPVRDAAGNIVDFTVTNANPAACAFAGTTRDELVGKRLLELFPSEAPSLRLAMYRNLMENGQPLVMNDFTYPGEKDVTRRFDIRATRVEGSISYTWRDVTERYNAAQEMEKRARFDQLTDLLSRSEALDRIEAANERRTGRKMAVLFCDVDNFKTINDTRGHRAGDEVLREIAVRMKKCLRSNDDLAARLGGDELLVVLAGVRDLNDAMAVAEKLRRSIAEPMTIPGGSVRATVSIGVTLADPRESVDSMVARADAALYGAKQTGRNQVISILPPEHVLPGQTA